MSLKTKEIGDVPKEPHPNEFRGTEGLAEGRTEGLAEGLRHTVEDLCELLGIELSQTHSDFLASATVDDLEALRARLKRDRRWDPAIE